jgi:hypothetical protein
MSDYEYHRGKLRKVELEPGQSLADLARTILVKHNTALQRDIPDDDIIEIFRDTFWKEEYMVVNDTIYALEDHTCSNEPPETAELSPLPDGRIAFTAYFYNGGTGLDEMLGEALEGL